MRDRDVTVAVIGLGYWGPNLLRALTDTPGVDVVWMCDLDPLRLGKYGRRYPAVRQTTSVDEVLADPAVDAVIIATPVFTHVDLCARALRAGKHAFVEKPLATTSRDAEALMRLASEMDRVLMCGHTFLFSPAVNEVKRMLDEKVLGSVYFISSSRVNLGLHQRDISVVWDLGPHDFSILMHWLGEVPDTVRAVGRDSIVKGIADVAFVTLTFPSGIIANVELSWLSPSKLRRTVVVGSEKMVVYSDGSPEPVRLFDSGVVYRDPETFGEYQLSYRTGDIVSPRIASSEPLALEMAHFAAAVRDDDKLLYHRGLARDVVRVTEAAARSLENGGMEVSPERRTPFNGRTRAARIVADGEPSDAPPRIRL